MGKILLESGIDISCLFIAVLILVLSKETRRENTKRDKLFRLNLWCFCNTCLCSIVYYNLVPLFEQGKISEVAMYIFHNCFYVNLLFMFLLYIAYINDLFEVAEKTVKKINIIKWLVFGISVTMLLTSNFTHWGFYIVAGQIHRNITFNGVILAYISYILVISSIVLRRKMLMVKEIFHILITVIIIAVVSMGFQELFLDGRFTTVTFLIPIIALFHCLHSISYDMSTGAVSLSVLREEIKYYHQYAFVYLELPELKAGGISQELKKNLLSFNASFFKKYKIYRFKDDDFILIYNPKKETPNFLGIEHSFEALYKQFGYKYKVIIDKSCEISNVEALIEFCEYTRGRKGINSFSYVTDEERKEFEKHMYILDQLRDISLKDDIDDERVLAFCQPVYNIKTGKYTTGEALMRLRLPELGMVYPDQFIPLAERYDLLHAMSNIILNKTCKSIKQFLDQGYDIERISINYSVKEFNNTEFRTEFFEIIEKNYLPADKIAIELTESQDDYDFELVLENMTILENYNIKFYLDDYGTGYSNFERLIKLPFDVVKFDRSLLLSMKKDGSSKYMVSNMSRMFKEIGYSTLFEGVEDTHDEETCRNLGIDYLQGFKYSKPIPIEEIAPFLSKEA